MRPIVLLLCCLSLVMAQVQEDRQLEREFESMMRLLEVSSGSDAPTEEEAEARTADFQKRLSEFLSKWEPKESDLGKGRFSLGKAYAQNGRASDAARCFEAFVTRYPDSEDLEEATIALGTARLDARDAAGSLKILDAYLLNERYAKSARRPLALYYSALAAVELGDSALALARLDEARAGASETPIPADAAIQRIKILRDLGRIEEARKGLEELRQDNAESPFLEALREELEWYGKAPPELEAVDSWLFGDVLTLESLKGRVVVLNFFALRYPACRIALQRLGTLSQEGPLTNAVFLGVTKDYVPYDRVPREKQRQELEAGLRELNFTQRVAIASDFRNLRAFGVRGIPHTVVIGKDGLIRFVQVGASERDARGFEALRRAILREINR